jgi:hypothetical protein
MPAKRSLDAFRDYQGALAFLKGKSERKLSGTATRLHKLDDGSIAVRYHNADVVRYYPGGPVQYDNGGYQSVTTKARMGDYAPVGVYQKQGRWFFSDNRPYVNRAIRLNYDGFVIYAEQQQPGGRWLFNTPNMPPGIFNAINAADDGETEALVKAWLYDGKPMLVDYVQERS